MSSRRIGLRLPIPGRPITTGAITGRSSSRSWEQGHARGTEPLAIRQKNAGLGRANLGVDFYAWLRYFGSLTTVKHRCRTICRLGAAARTLAGLICLLPGLAVHPARADC